jgi:hypothetical protein
MSFDRRRFLLAAASAWTMRAKPALDAFDSLPQSVWKNARQNGLVMIHRPAPDGLASRTQIVSPQESGSRLTVEGLVFAPAGSTPVDGVTVYAYNTDADGYYGENHAEYPPRLYGWMKTDVSGRFILDTILPGHYPDMSVPAHVHFSLWAVGYPPMGGRSAVQRGPLPYRSHARGGGGIGRIQPDSSAGTQTGRRAPLQPENPPEDGNQLWFRVSPGLKPGNMQAVPGFVAHARIRANPCVSVLFAWSPLVCCVLKPISMP